MQSALSQKKPVAAGRSAGAVAAPGRPAAATGVSGASRHASCACDGRCPRCRSGGVAHAPRAASGAGEPFETEADRIADHTVRVWSVGPGVERVSPVHARPAGALDLNGPGGALVKPVLASAGVPLDDSIRRDLEARIGHDLGDVRIHADDRAAASAGAVGALAYASGSHIAFAQGRYAPETEAGEHLLAHEVAHVLQQRAGGARTAVPGHVAQLAPDPAEWAATMTPLRKPAIYDKLTPDQKRTLLDGLTQAVQGNPMAIALGLILPVQDLPADEYEPGHVYFDRELLNQPAKTSLVCRKGSSQVLSPECTVEDDLGDAIIVGPKAIEDTLAFTQSVFDHEFVHFAIGVARRRGQAGPHQAWLAAVDEPDGNALVDKEDTIAYAAQFAHVFEFSEKERYGVVAGWAERYSHASPEVRELSMEEVRRSLGMAYGRASSRDTGPLRADLSLVQGCYLENTCKIKWKKDQWAAIANAMYDVRTHLDVLEGKPE